LDNSVQLDYFLRKKVDFLFNLQPKQADLFIVSVAPDTLDEAKKLRWKY